MSDILKITPVVKDYAWGNDHFIADLLSIDRNGPMEGIGDPEALKGNLQGFFSRRINEKDRLVYRSKLL